MLNLAEGDFQESVIKHEGFREVDSVETLSSDTARAGEPEEDDHIVEHLEDEAGNTAHPLVVGISNELELLSCHPVAPGEHELSDAIEDLRERNNQLLGAREVQELLL